MSPEVMGIAIVVGTVLALVIAFGRRRSRTAASGIEDALAAHGAMRCIAIEGVLARLATRGGSPDIVAAWARLERPLLEALPDCPPDLKAPLAWTLERCAQACSNRAIAQSLMTVRNGLMP
ncbi:MAG: hypothetical protein H0V44_01520 [Planctomycetes bacterium]|nr:hypothetical protein [Planctomycetota bacterium]